MNYIIYKQIQQKYLLQLNSEKENFYVLDLATYLFLIVLKT